MHSYDAYISASEIHKHSNSQPISSAHTQKLSHVFANHRPPLANSHPKVGDPVPIQHSQIRPSANPSNEPNPNLSFTLITNFCPPASVDNHVLATLCYRCGSPRRRSGHCPRLRHFHCSPYDFYLFVTPPPAWCWKMLGFLEDTAVGAGCEGCSWSLRLT